jgi:hypothetical protein
MATKQKSKTAAAPFAVMDWPANRVEMWKGIPEIYNYEVSNRGRIRSLDRKLEFIGRWGHTVRFHRGRILRLKPKPNGDGGIYWCFYIDGGKYLQVNRSVCAAFHGCAPSFKHEAAHLDGDTHNNTPENLIWATALENAAHKKRHGTNPTGSKNAMAVIDEKQIKSIFESYIFGIDRQTIADRYGVTDGAIRSIVTGNTWRHVDVGELRQIAKLRAQRNLENSWRLAAARRAERGPSLQRA